MSRVDILNQGNNNHSNIVYFMTKSFRIRNNYSLYEALTRVNELGGVLEVIIIPPAETELRQHDFFTEMTKDLNEKLSELLDQVSRVNWNDLDLNQYQTTHTFILDKAYLKEDKARTSKLVDFARNQEITVIEVDSNVFQPVRDVSQKEEYSARTIRNKIWRLFLQPLVLMSEDITYGEQVAHQKLETFIEDKMRYYEDRNDPSLDYVSGLSPFLKYGLISPNVIYEIVMDEKRQGSEPFLEELIVRRELAYNFVCYNEGYDDFHKMTYPWAYETMQEHIHDARKYLYTIDDYINFKTHDPYFNAAMKEMVHLGKMHSYMRMYWCKKIIEWSKTYEEAYNTAITLNNRYFLDGNTPNGYAGVAWCFGKHDRAWTERPIFGKLRYMNDNGLKRKFDIESYVTKIEERIRSEAK